jgi:hypothetical protein
MAAKRKPTPKILQNKPLMASYEQQTFAAAATRTRSNRAASIERTKRYANIDDGLIPFKYTSGKYNTNSSLDIKDAITLCQKAYYNFAIFRNTIDLMTEFSCSPIYFCGGNKKSRDFFEAFFRKVNIAALQDKFFREYYRSGNIYVYRFFSKLNKSDLLKINQTYADLISEEGGNKVPSRYIILNPADILMNGNVSFANANYYKNISDYELERLRNPRTEDDKQVLQSLPKEVKDQIKDGKSTQVRIPLDKEKVTAIFYKKQDYEPFAVPMGYPVLEDINWKAELKKMDMAISRTMQQAVLLVTMGADPEKGGVNQKNLEAMQKLFENESVGRVLIADYTTKAEFVIPNIAAILNPVKYEMVNKDIQIGLNNILVSGDEKFANAQIKTQVFVERLMQGRQVFLEEFLIPEIKKVSKTLGFKNYPEPKFEDIELKDETTYSRIYTRLLELGVLTPEESIEAISSGRLPTAEESKEAQERYRDLRDDGLYEPVLGGPFSTEKAAKVAQKNNQQSQNVPKENGRPEGTGTPQETKKIVPIGANEFKFSLEKIKENLIAAQKLGGEVEAELRKTYKKRKLSKAQKSVASQISELIIANEEPSKWSSRIKDYLKSPMDKNIERVDKIKNISYDHQVDTYLASILYNSITS